MLFSFIPNEDNKNLPVKTEKSDAIKKKIVISNIFKKISYRSLRKGIASPAPIFKVDKPATLLAKLKLSLIVLFTDRE